MNITCTASIVRIGIAVFMTTFGSIVSRAAQDAPDAPSTPPPAGQSASPAPTLSDKAGQALDATKETAQEVWDATKEKSKALYRSVRDAARGGIVWLDDATFDARADVAARLGKLADKVGAKIAEWKADAKELTPEAKARLDKALVDFRAASKDLGNATASTWNTAKAKVRSSWDTLQKTIRDPNATCDDGSSCNDKAPEAGGAALEN